MGVLGAMAAIGLGSVLPAARSGRWVAAILGGVAVLVIGAPWWGANWGGAFATGAGLVGVWLAWARPGWRRSLLVAAVALAASALVPAALDLLRPAAERTHIGTSAAALLHGDLGTLADTIRRKAAINWGLVLSYRWALLGWLLAAGVLWRLLGRRGPARRALDGQRGLAAGIFGAIMLAVVAMLVNDSGLVAATLAMAVTIGVVIFLAARPAETYA
jgi:hypothetical protein